MNALATFQNVRENLRMWEQKNRHFFADYEKKPGIYID